MRIIKYNLNEHHRRSIRLKGYDYSQDGAYYFTVCAQNHEILFGEIVGEKMILNDAGMVVIDVWDDLINHISNIQLDEFIVMPNHIHGVIVTNQDCAISHDTGRKHGLPEIIRQLKTFSARRINAIRKTPAVPIWQRNYYEHIIRNEQSLMDIREYIINNPMNWQQDEMYPRRGRF